MNFIKKSEEVKITWVKLAVKKLELILAINFKLKYKFTGTPVSVLNVCSTW